MTPLDTIKTYGCSLQDDQDVQTQKKSSLILEIAIDLSQKIAQKPLFTVEPTNSQELHQTQVENLKFKLQLIDKIHQIDKLAANHREIKKCITSFCSVLLTNKIPTIFHDVIAGNALFFSQSQLRKKPCDTQHDIHFDITDKTNGHDNKPI